VTAERKSVYIETTIPSYLTARPSRDLLKQAHQQVTCLWWDEERANYDLFVSRVVLEEAARGDQLAAKRRLAALAEAEVLAAVTQIDDLAELYIQELQIPARASADALHLAYSVYYQMDFLITWNCTHLQNPVLINKVAAINLLRGLHMPAIATPEQMLAMTGKADDDVEA
jgi:hypothetical protein